MTFKMFIYNELRINLDTFVDYLLNMVARQFCCLGDFCRVFQCRIWFYSVHYNSQIFLILLDFAVVFLILMLMYAINLEVY